MERCEKQRPVIVSFFKLENSSHTDRCAVIYIGISNTGSRCTRVYNRTVTRVDADVTTVTYNITRLCLCETHLIAHASHRTGRMWQSDSERTVYTHNKS